MKGEEVPPWQINLIRKYSWDNFEIRGGDEKGGKISNQLMRWIFLKFLLLVDEIVKDIH